MRNKIVMILSLCLIALSSNCFAMTFSQPIKLGSVLLDFGRSGGYMLKGTTSNNGAYYRDNKTRYKKALLNLAREKTFCTFITTFKYQVYSRLVKNAMVPYKTSK